MKKLIGSLFAALTVSTLTAVSTFAFQMSQPVEIGEAHFRYKMGGGHYFINAEEINATKFQGPNNFNHQLYGKGYAVFDNGKLYVHIIHPNSHLQMFGGADLNSTVKCHNGKILKINTDQDITIYAVIGGYLGNALEIIGRRADGRYVKYASGGEICFRYGDEHKDKRMLKQIKAVTEDAIIFSCDKYVYKLQWDDEAQWFSVSRIE